MLICLTGLILNVASAGIFIFKLKGNFYYSYFIVLLLFMYMKREVLHFPPNLHILNVSKC